MRKYYIYLLLSLFLLMGNAACKAKHCPAYDDTMEGYEGSKKKKGRKEGLFDKKM